MHLNVGQYALESLFVWKWEDYWSERQSLKRSSLGRERKSRMAIEYVLCAKIFCKQRSAFYAYNMQFVACNGDSFDEFVYISGSSLCISSRLFLFLNNVLTLDRRCRINMCLLNGLMHALSWRCFSAFASSPSFHCRLSCIFMWSGVKLVRSKLAQFL